MPTLFSRAFVPSARDNEDSERLRRRLGAKSWEYLRGNERLQSAFKDRVVSELGVRWPPSTSDVFVHGDMRDVLDSVTLFASVLGSYGDRRAQFGWLEFCERAMREEGMKYQVQADGSVGYFVDSEFQGAADDAVAALNVPRFTAASAAIASAVRELNRLDGSPKAAIRETYAAVETAFKVAVDSSVTLGASDVEKRLVPAIDRLFANADPVARGAAAQVAQAMKDWVNAAHKYRHGHEHADPIEPSRELAITLVGLGITFARFIGDHFKVETPALVLTPASHQNAK